MATQEKDSKSNPENKNTPNPHEHPQNASGKAGKEISSDQDETDFDQSSENESYLNQIHITQSQLNPTSRPYQHQEEKENPLTGEDHSDKKVEEPTDKKSATEPSEKDPVDRPIKDENGELI